LEQVFGGNDTLKTNTILAIQSHNIIFRAARGCAQANSDIDLLVVMDLAGSKRRAAMEIDRALADREVPLDAIVMAPMEFEQ